MEDARHGGHEGGEGRLDLPGPAPGGAPDIRHDHDDTTIGHHGGVHLPDLPVDPSVGGSLAAGTLGILELQ